MEKIKCNETKFLTIILYFTTFVTEPEVEVEEEDAAVVEEEATAVAASSLFRQSCKMLERSALG